MFPIPQQTLPWPLHRSCDCEEQIHSRAGIHISSKMNRLKPKHFFFFPNIVKKFISPVKLDILKLEFIEIDSFFLELASSGSSWNCNTASYLFVIPENITFWARHPALSPFCRIVSCFSAGGQKSLEHSSIVCKPNKTPCIHRSCICLQYQYFCVHFLLYSMFSSVIKCC